MNREQLDNWLERGILVLVLGVLIFGPLATGAVRPVDFLVLQGLTLAAGVLWLARLWLAPQHRLLWPPICWAVLAFTGYAIWRYFQADIEYVARDELLHVIVYAFLFLLIINNLNRQEATQAVVYVMVFLAMLIAMYGLLQMATGSNKVWNFIRPDSYKGRASGTYICPNHFAGFLELVLPLALAYTLTGRINHVLRIFLGYAALVILIGIGASVSRGGWIATVISMGVFCALLVRAHSFRIPALIAVVLLLGGVIFGVMKADVIAERVARSFQPGQLDYIFGRVPIWDSAYRMWKDNPWTGVGPGHFDYRFRQYRRPDYQFRPLRAHNDYLNTLADWGVAGAAIIGTALGFLIFGITRTWKFVQRSNDLSSRTSNRASFVLGVTASLAAILAHSFFDFNMNIPANAILTIALMALATVHLRFASEKYWVTPGVLLRLALTLILGAGGWYLAAQGVQRGREVAVLSRADQAERATQREIRAIAQAYKADPVDFDKAEKLGTQLHQDAERMRSALKEANAGEPANFETTYRLGEAIRATGWGQLEKEKQALTEAMEWYQRGMKLNPWDPYNYLRAGMCLDQLGDHKGAQPMYDRAQELDPEGYFTLAHIGWHYVQLGDYAKAKPWFEKSLKLKIHDGLDGNPVAYTYLKIVNERLAEEAGKKK
ncbi:MAG TPA: O-antigen ligase family protein [Verrucomicrobiae bacterium]|nr:O-antigen ligase family protein [Verrucomicrobiae bacterium]